MSSARPNVSIWPRSLVTSATTNLSAVIALTAALSACNAPAHLPQSTLDHRVSAVENPALKEISGLSRSGKSATFLWMHNDSGAASVLYAVGRDGSHLGGLSIAGIPNAVDWEDMAHFTHQGQSYLLIGDIGDNAGLRDHVTLYAIREPTLPTKQPFAIVARPDWTINVSFPDGPRDCEALAVDEQSGKILLLSKRDIPPRLYSVPLDRSLNHATATFVGEMLGLPAPNAFDLSQPHEKNRSRPTAMDISPDGAQLGVLTYKNAYLITRSQQGWAAALADQPVTLHIPQLAQAEGGGFSRDGRHWFSASEKRPAALVETRL